MAASDVPHEPAGASPSREAARHRFGDFVLEPRERRLERSGSEIPLTAKQLDTLIVLVESAGRLIRREELIAAVWPDTIVEEANLTWVVSHLRRVLGEEAIETVRGHGYRFRPAVETELPVPPRGQAPRAETTAARPAFGDLPAPLDAEPGAGGFRVAGRQHPRPWRRWVWATTAAGGALFGLLAAGAAPRAPAAVAGAPRVAVLPFEDPGGRDSTRWLGPALAELVAAELARGSGAALASNEQVARARRELAVVPAASYAPETLRRLGRSLGVQAIVAGGYVLVPGDSEKLRFAARLQRTSDGETLATVSLDGTLADLLELSSSAAGELRAALQLPPPSGPGPTLPRTLEARRAWAEGVAALAELEMRRAVASFERVIELESDFALAWYGRARALGWLGFERDARLAAERAFLLSADLPEPERVRIEVYFRRISGRAVEAIPLLERRVAAAPESIDDACDLARLELDAGRAEAAIATIDALLARVPAARVDARVPLIVSTAAERLGRTSRALAEARRGVEIARLQGSPRLEAESRVRAAFALGGASPARLAEARSELDAAQPLVERARDPGLELRWRWALGNTEYAASRVDLRRVEEAESAWRGALGAARAAGMGLAELRLLGNLAQLENLRGELISAERYYRQAIEQAAALGSEDARGVNLMRIAVTLRHRGGFVDSRAAAIEAAAIFERLGERLRRAESLSELADVELAEGNPEAAARIFAGLAVEFREIERPAAATWAEVDRAWAELELEPRPADLAGRLERLLAEDPGDDRFRLASVRCALAAARLAAGDVAGARAEAGRGAEEARPPRWPGVAWRCAQVEAEVLAAAGELGAARAAAERIQAQARRVGARPAELEAGFLLARLAHRRGEPMEARLRLEELLAAAEAINFRSLVRRARPLADQLGG